MNFRTKLFDYEVEYLNYHLKLHRNIEVDYWKDKDDSYIDWKCELSKTNKYLEIVDIELERVFLKLYFNIDIDDLDKDQIDKLCVDYNGDVVDRLQVVEGTIIIDTLVQKDWDIKFDIIYRDRLHPQEVYINLMDKQIVIQ